MTPRTFVSRLAKAFVLGIFFIAKCSSAQSPSPDDDWKQYQFILQKSTLEWLLSQPFLLKVDYQLYDLNGKPVGKGSAEESWTKAEEKGIRIQSPSLTENIPEDYDNFEKHTRESYLVHQAMSALARPFPVTIKQNDFAMERFRTTVGGVDRNCFVLVPPGKRLDTTETYCTDIDNHIVAMTGQLFVLERTGFRKYLNHEIPTDLRLSYEGRTALTLHVTELDPLPGNPAAESSKGAALIPQRIPAAFMAGERLTKKDPEYPKQAKKKHIGGSVILMAIITKQGTMTAMDIVASPDPMLSKAALDAVSTWTYKPYLLNGELIAVDTTITVNFNLNGR